MSHMFVQVHPALRVLNAIERATDWCVDTYADHMMLPTVNVWDAPLVDVPAISPRERRVKLILQARRKVLGRHLVPVLLLNPIGVALFLSVSTLISYLLLLLSLLLWVRCVQQVKGLTTYVDPLPPPSSPFPYR